MTSRPAHLTRRQVIMAVGGVTLASAIPGGGVAAMDQLAAHNALAHPLTWADLAGCPLLDGANPFWVQAAEEIMAEQAARG